MREHLSEKERQAFVEAGWQAVWQHFYDPHFGGVDWMGVRQEFLDRARHAETLEELDQLTQEMFNRLGVSHNVVLPPEIVAGLRARPEEVEKGVSWRQMEDGLGYLRVAIGLRPYFQSADLQAAMEALHPCPGLVIDMRGNRGGPVVEVADYLVEAGWPYQYERTRHGRGREEATPLPEFDEDRLYVRETGFVTRHGFIVVRTEDPPGPRYHGPVAVLINGECHSGSEIFAQFMKETGRARLFGTRTAGQVLRSRLVPLTQGYFALVVISQIWSGKGVYLEGVGVTPDVEVEDTEDDPDRSLRAAVAWLHLSSH